MPDSRSGRAWFSMVVALVALLAFTPQAGATEYEPESNEPVACSAYEESEDPCSEDDPPVGCAAGGYEDDDRCSDDDPVGDSEPDEEEPKDEEPEQEKPDLADSKSDDGVRSCDDGPLARGAEGSEDGVQFEDGCLPQFGRRFITRVWKFVGEVDYYEEGVLSMTLGKILNLPRKWRTQDDELLDQDTTVLVSERVRVFQEGERVGRGALDAANEVRVHGKLLRPSKWLEDEDGETVTTIRAKKVYITG